MGNRKEMPYEKETVRSRHGNRNRNHWRFSCFGGLVTKRKNRANTKNHDCYVDGNI